METIDENATPHDSEDSFLTQFMGRLTQYLEDGNDAHSVKRFIATQYVPRPLGDPRNAIIRLVRQYLPLLTVRELADVCLTDKATVSRVLNGDNTGGKNRGHGGPRR